MVEPPVSIIPACSAPACTLAPHCARWVSLSGWREDFSVFLQYGIHGATCVHFIHVRDCWGARQRTVS